MTGAGVVVITSGFPRRSETFAANELMALEETGALAAVFATKPGDAVGLHPGTERIARCIQYLAPGPPEDQAAEAIGRINGTGVTGVHGYFAHLPAEVAALVGAGLGVPWGFSVHARDARKVSRAELSDRARRAVCVIACNPDVAREFPAGAGDVHVVPHGVDLGRFRPAPLLSRGPSEATPFLSGGPSEAAPRLPARGRPVSLLAVGRLVEKKGFDVLIDAVAALTIPFRLRIVGEGPERRHLERAIAGHGLSDRVQLCGGLSHLELPSEYAAADVVVVPSVVDATGDRDGLPNVILEAMASGCAVVAADVGAIASAVEDDRTGILIPPGDDEALTAAITELAVDPGLRTRLGCGARKRVERDFDLARCTERFARILGEAYG